MRLRLPVGTVEYISAVVRLDRDQSNPTTYEVEYALLDPDLTPTEPDWLPAEWVVGGPPYRARALITGVAGTYRFWLRITGSGESVLRQVGIIEFI